jgi:hypothetical protein
VIKTIQSFLVGPKSIADFKSDLYKAMTPANPSEAGGPGPSYSLWGEFEEMILDHLRKKSHQSPNHGGFLSLPESMVTPGHSPGRVSPSQLVLQKLLAGEYQFN